MKSPHQVSHPTDSSIQDITLVGSLLLVLDRETHRDVPGRCAPTVPASQKRSGTRRAHAGSSRRQGRTIEELLPHLVVLQSMLRDKVRQILDSFVDVFAATSLHHVVGGPPSPALGLL